MYLIFGFVFLVLVSASVFLVLLLNKAVEKSMRVEGSCLPPIDDIVLALRQHIETMNKSSKAILAVEDTIKQIQERGYDISTPGELRLLAQTIRPKHKNKYPNGFLEAAAVIEKAISSAVERESSGNGE